MMSSVENKPRQSKQSQSEAPIPALPPHPMRNFWRIAAIAFLVIMAIGYFALFGKVTIENQSSKTLGPVTVQVNGETVQKLDSMEPGAKLSFGYSHLSTKKVDIEILHPSFRTQCNFKAKLFPRFTGVIGENGGIEFSGKKIAESSQVSMSNYVE